MLSAPFTTTKITLNSLQTVKNFPLGYFGWKDLSSTYLGVSPNVPELFSLKHSEDVIGLSEFDLHEHKEFIPEIINHDLVTHRGEEWKGFELTNWKNFGEIIVFSTKAPLYDNDNIIGTFLHTQPIKSKKIFELYAVLEKFREKIEPSIKNKKSSYEICGKQVFSTLTSREHECLFFTIRGKTAKQIAFILNLSVRTIEYYLDNIKMKLDCRTKAQLVAKAVSEGYIKMLPKSILDKISLTLLMHD